ncbi:hypothetical protein J21TS7_60520 [Paenibacillus cineris]|uniref:Uncharacterized protein n=1 Tax=Paenibacillus cineris TaxID=237530 RepID=A0ABQ4LMJ4_9BACL|nr:hypothetical protein J21TS7_60520 [Paenibacillus cineris]
MERKSANLSTDRFENGYLTAVSYVLVKSAVMDDRRMETESHVKQQLHPFGEFHQRTDLFEA